MRVVTTVVEYLDLGCAPLMAPSIAPSIRPSQAFGVLSLWLIGRFTSFFVLIVGRISISGRLTGRPLSTSRFIREAGGTSHSPGSVVRRLAEVATCRCL